MTMEKIKKFSSYRRFLKWLRKGNISWTAPIRISIGGITFNSPIDCAESYEE